jgi:hypothetical protein
MAEKIKKRPRDPVQLAKLIGDIATGQIIDKEDDGKDLNAIALGKKGGAKRAASLTPQKRKEIAQKAAQTRWNKN